ncbi:MAG: hypothetical protein J1E29_05690 [Duncaniella sp.]|nr:hypothetical protein [Duncaniella sp.]
MKRLPIIRPPTAVLTVRSEPIEMDPELLRDFLDVKCANSWSLEELSQYTELMVALLTARHERKARLSRPAANLSMQLPS